MTQALPYRAPAGDVVVATGWARRVTDGSVPLAASIDDWDYNTTLDLDRTVRLAGARLRSEAGLSPDQPLCLSVRWTASESLLRGSVFRAAVPQRDDEMVRIRCTLPGRDLGGVLTLETTVALSERVRTGAAPRTATLAGSVLWRDTRDVRLQGNASTFPIATADFEDLPHPSDAPWYLEMKSDFDAPTMGALLLVVNTRCVALAEAVRCAAQPDLAQRRILSALRAEVATQLIEHALVSEEFDARVHYATGTLGAAVVGLLLQLSLSDIASLRRERRREPALFAARLNHANKLWSDE